MRLRAVFKEKQHIVLGDLLEKLFLGAGSNFVLLSFERDRVSISLDEVQDSPGAANDALNQGNMVNTGLNMAGLGSSTDNGA